MSVKPINLTVRFCNPLTGLVETVLISAFCRLCGRNRGRPKIAQEVDGDGEPMLVHRWNNKCGHIDTDASIANEIDMQCAGPTCVTLASTGVCYPYCGEECAVHAGLNIIGDLRSVITRLDEVNAVLATMLEMIEHPDLTVVDPVNLEGAKQLWWSNCTNTTDAINRAQMNLIEAIAHGSNGYTMEGTAKYL